MKKVLLSIVVALFFVPATLFAQGELGFGETDDSAMSLLERVSNIEQKFKAFNVYVNFSGDFNLQKAPYADAYSSGFEARQLRLEMKGQIGDHVYYRVRQRLNKSNVALKDGLAKATDYAMIGYRFNPQWLVSVGKMGQYFGGFEFDQNAIYVYQGSDISNNADGSKIGIALTWTPVKNHTFVAQVTNAYNGNLQSEYIGAVEQGIVPSHNPYTVVGNWSGQFADGIYRVKSSFVNRKLASDQNSQVVVVGQSVNGAWGRVFLDYAYEKDDFDYMRFCSLEAARYLGPSQSYLTDLSYNALVARTDIKVGKHVILWAEGMYQTASCNSVAELKNFRKHSCYLGGLEFVPNPDYKVRYTLNFQHERYDYSKLSALPDYSTNRIEVGILCRLKCF